MSQVEHLLKMDPMNEENNIFKNYFLLMKPELTLLSVFTSLCSAFLAVETNSDVSIMTFVLLGIGTFLVGGGSGALNQFFERSYDAVMNRTKHRPIPSGKIQPSFAQLFGLIASSTGFSVLFSINLLTGILSVLTSLSYLFLYTPLKRISTSSTVIGAIPGALPILIGWASVQNEISIKALTLFGVLFYWQAPHFYSLAWMYKEDYAKAGFRFLTIVDTTGKRVAGFIIANLSALLILSILPLIIDKSSAVIFVLVITVGTGFLLKGFQFFQSISGSTKTDSKIAARNLFFVSLVYIPLYFSLLVAEKIFK
ncbi:MAG: heme o synthase [Bacteroidota bacterium]|jgi:protoheme IX farnesyltransferase